MGVRSHDGICPLHFQASHLRYEWLISVELLTPQGTPQNFNKDTDFASHIDWFKVTW